MRTLLTKKQAAKKIGMHPESLMRLARAGRVPAPIRTGDSHRHSVRFIEEELDAWVEQRMAARTEA